MMNSDKTPTLDVQFVLNQLKSIASAVMHAAEAQTLEQVLEQIAHVARDLIGTRYAALGIPSQTDTLLYFKFAGVSPEEASHMDHLPHGYGLLGAVMMERETLLVDHIHQDSRSIGFPAGHPVMDRFLGTPIQVGEQLFGMLYLCDRLDGAPFNEQDQWLIETLAGYAALAIAGTRLREKHQRLTLLEERERISMELHDGVIQSLYAVGMHLELLRTGDRPINGELSGVVEELNHVIDDIRDYIMNLKKQRNNHQTIRGCLQDLVRRLHIPNTIAVIIDAPETLPAFTETTFESICQIVYEAVSNSVRHAHAHQVNITALQNENLLMINIKDDGIGFNTDHIDQFTGLGLQHIRQRAQNHGGLINIESGIDQGTRLTVTIPVKV